MFFSSYNKIRLFLAQLVSARRLLALFPVHMFCSVANLNLLRLAWFTRDPVQTNRGFMKMHDILVVITYRSLPKDFYLKKGIIGKTAYSPVFLHSILVSFYLTLLYSGKHIC